MTTYPLFDAPPRQSQSATSVAAAERLAPHLGAAQARVLEAIRAAGERGLTDNEGIALTGMFNGYRARRIELYRAGLVKPNGTREGDSGNECVVWRSLLDNPAA